MIAQHDYDIGNKFIIYLIKYNKKSFDIFY